MYILDYRIEHFLLNLFFIMFPLVFYQYILLPRYVAKPVLKNLLQYCIFTIPIILCMAFPPSNVNGFSLNLYSIPLILACFYCDRKVTQLFVLITLICSRILFGGDGVSLTLFAAVFCYLLTFICFNRYQQLRLSQKVMIACLISIISKLTSKVLYLLLNTNHVVTLHVTFYIIESFCMAITLYTIEAIIKDIQIKNELIDSEKMKIASVISASVAHEIRNPLTSVRGFIQLLSTAPDLSAEKRRYYGQICIDELDRAEQIISDYLSLARPYPDIYEKLIIGEEINYISTVLSSYANLKGVEITVENDEIDLLILGDRQKFRQSIINIVKNGIEAMEQGGILTLNVYKQDNRVHVMINDKGIGMTKEQINRLGTPYFSSKEKGTGLGTMVSFSIIKGMNGIISVMSEVGKGTQYNVSFPLS